MAGSGRWWVAATAVACYALSLGNGLVYDDQPIIAENPRIRSPVNVRAIWLRDWWANRPPHAFVADPGRDRLYRPLTLQSLALDYAFWGQRAAGYHAVNILLHALVSVLVWRIASVWLRDGTSALIAGLLFAVHPVHAEAVCMIVGRAELLAALFTLSGLLIIPRNDPLRRARAASMGLAFFAAILSKESGLVYPALAAVWIAAFGLWPRWSVRERVLAAAALLVPLALYVPLRYAAVGGQLIRTGVEDLVNNPLAGADGWQRLIGLLTVFGHYLRLLLVPRTLSCDYGLAVIDPTRGPDVWTVAGAVGALTLTGWLVAGWRRRRTPQSLAGRTAPLVLMFLFAYAPASNVLLIGVAVGERLMYLPSAPLLIALGAAAACAMRGDGHGAAPRARIAAALGGCLLLALGLRTVARTLDWRDNFTLFTTDVQTFPQSLRLNTMVGDLYLMRAGHTRDPQQRQRLLRIAARYFERALAIKPRDAASLRRLAEALEALGQPERARALYQRAVALNPTDAYAIAGLRRTAATQPAPIAPLEAALATRPADAALRVRLAAALIAAGQPQRALRVIDQVAAAARRNPRLLELRAEALLMLIRDEEAARTYLRLLALEPDNWKAHANLARLLAKRDPAAALEHARVAARLRPDDARVQINLAEALLINGRRSQAIEVYRRLLPRLVADDPLRAAVADRIRELSRRP